MKLPHAVDFANIVLRSLVLAAALRLFQSFR
jgi:hypothetical protein